MATWCEFTPAGSCPDFATARSELAALKAENERLRGALAKARSITARHWNCLCCEIAGECPCCRAEAIIDAALAGSAP